METTLIVHGWSDCSASFVQLKEFLIANGLGDVDTVLYADYESREDNITFDDVIDGLNDQLREHGIIDGDGRKLRDLNVVVHSTGGLVIRHWLARYYAADNLGDCPLKRIVMLAPANFGSPLAHRGKSFLGSLVKGRWKVGDFLEVGRNILTGLELGSSYQWDLAHRDLLRGAPYYGADRIQLTVLVGNTDYTGLRGWVNKPGTDGTVVIAGAPLNTIKLSLDFSKRTAGGAAFAWHTTGTSTDFAFAVLDGLDHGSLVAAAADQAGTLASGLVLKALQTQAPADFSDLRQLCTQTTAATYAASGKKVYQQFIVHAVDDQGVAIRDFTLEFFIRRVGAAGVGEAATVRRLNEAEERFSDEAHNLLLSECHTFEADSSYRRLLVCRSDVEEILGRARTEFGEAMLCLRIHVPKIDDNIRYNTDGLQQLVLLRTDQPVEPQLFYDNTTTLVELSVDRYTGYVTVGAQPRRH